MILCVQFRKRRDLIALILMWTVNVYLFMLVVNQLVWALAVIADFFIYSWALNAAKKDKAVLRSHQRANKERAAKRAAARTEKRDLPTLD